MHARNKKMFLMFDPTIHLSSSHVITYSLCDHFVKKVLIFLCENLDIEKKIDNYSIFAENIDLGYKLER